MFMPPSTSSSCWPLCVIVTIDSLPCDYLCWWILLVCDFINANECVEFPAKEDENLAALLFSPLAITNLMMEREKSWCLDIIMMAQRQILNGANCFKWDDVECKNIIRSSSLRGIQGK